MLVHLHTTDLYTFQNQTPSLIEARSVLGTDSNRYICAALLLGEGGLLHRDFAEDHHQDFVVHDEVLQVAQSQVRSLITISLLHDNAYPHEGRGHRLLGPSLHLQVRVLHFSPSHE